MELLAMGIAAGRACNILKKLDRERMGHRGSRATPEQLAEELADVAITADLIAMDAGIDLNAAIVAKFNATSEKYGLRARLTAPALAPKGEGDSQLGDVVDERDAAEEAVSQAYYLVTGRSPEWSNVFGYEQALAEIADDVRLLKESAKPVPPKGEGEADVEPREDGFYWIWQPRGDWYPVEVEDGELWFLGSEHKFQIGDLINDGARFRHLKPPDAASPPASQPAMQDGDALAQFAQTLGPGYDRTARPEDDDNTPASQPQPGGEERP